MSPIDPAIPASASPHPPMAPSWVDEDPNADSVQQGLDTAEDELRDAVADAYEDRAVHGDNADEDLDDIDYTSNEDESISPEIAALHGEFIPFEDSDSEDEEPEDYEKDE